MSEHPAQRTRGWDGQSRGRVRIRPKMSEEDLLVTLSEEDYARRAGEKVMADHDWFVFEGSPRNISSLYKTLATNAHFLVSGTKTSLYIRIQHSESLFVTSVAKTHSVRTKLVDEPEFEEAPCGKNTLDVNKHCRACKGCKRLRGNVDAAQASSLRKAVNALVDTPSDLLPENRSPDRKYQSGVGSTQPENPLIPPPSIASQRRQENLDWESKSGEVTTYPADSLGPPEEVIESTVNTNGTLPQIVSNSNVEDSPPTQPDGGATADWLNDMAHYYMEISFKYGRLADLVKSLGAAKEMREAAQKQYEDTRKSLLSEI